MALCLCMGIVCAEHCHRLTHLHKQARAVEHQLALQMERKSVQHYLQGLRSMAHHTADSGQQE